MSFLREGTKCQDTTSRAEQFPKRGSLAPVEGTGFSPYISPKYVDGLQPLMDASARTLPHAHSSRSASNASTRFRSVSHANIIRAAPPINV